MVRMCLRAEGRRQGMPLGSFRPPASVFFAIEAIQQTRVKVVHPYSTVWYFYEVLRTPYAINEYYGVESHKHLCFTSSTPARMSLLTLLQQYIIITTHYHGVQNAPHL